MSSFFLHPNDANRDNVKANACALIDGLREDKAWRIDVEIFHKERTLPQNSALWGHAYKIVCAATGQDVNDWHEYFLGEHFGWIEKDYFGKRKLRPARTTTTNYEGKNEKLNTKEFMDYFDFVQRRAAQNGIHIPDPDPMWRRQMMDRIATEEAEAAKCAEAA